VRKFVKRYGEIENIYLKQNIFGWTSHAIVEFFWESSADKCAVALKWKWLGANKLRIVTGRQKVTESFNHRTVVIGNLNDWTKPDEVTWLFS